MRSLPEPGTDPGFVLKALGEAAGEARRTLAGVSRRLLVQPAPPPDDGWCLLALATHLRDVERGFVAQIEAFFEEPEPARLRHVDIDALPIEEEYVGEDEDAVLDELHYLRRHSTYLLWGLGSRDWARTAEHPYRGTLTLADLAREMYRHDLEHLWQARRIVDALRGGRPG